MAKKNVRRLNRTKEHVTRQWKPTLDEKVKYDEFVPEKSQTFEGLWLLMEANDCSVKFKPSVAGKYPTVSVACNHPDRADFNCSVWWYVLDVGDAVKSVSFFLDHIGIEHVHKNEATDVLGL